MNFKQALEYLDSLIKPVVFARIRLEDAKLKDPLDRMRILLKLLGNPQDKFKSVQVSGTSGKGSTAYLISHILTTAGYKTGLTISPHLQKINERLQINGKPISDKEFTKMVSSIVDTIELMKKMPIGEPSYFEITMAMAFKYFAEQKVDIGVVEVGIEGKYDASNTLRPLVAVLTNIDLDHTELLGNTVEKIAKEAVSIIKKLPEKAQIVVTGVKQPSVIKIVEEKARKVGAKLYRLHKDFDLTKYEVSLLGDYQKENASLAIETVLQLKKFGFKISDENIKKALKTAFFPGRFEVIKCHPELVSGSPARRQASLQSNEMLKQVQHDKEKTLILDGAHNPTKMKAFLASLKKLFPQERKIFIVGFKFDKDIPKMLRQIAKVADTIIVTEFDRATDMAVSSSADALNLKSQISNFKYVGQVVVENDSKKALDLALNYPITKLPNYPTIIVVTGSLYLVGEIRGYITKIPNSNI